MYLLRGYRALGMPCWLPSSGPSTASSMFDKERAMGTPILTRKTTPMHLGCLPSSRPTALDIHRYILSDFPSWRLPRAFSVFLLPHPPCVRRLRSVRPRDGATRRSSATRSVARQPSRRIAWQGLAPGLLLHPAPSCTHLACS